MPRTRRSTAGRRVSVAPSKPKSYSLKFICTPDFLKKMEKMANKHNTTRTMVIRESALFGLVHFDEWAKQMKKEGKL